ncbi:MAG: preprotein translocase subunit SecG [Candidatus Eremiobacteraeota bacterium]|nr:preprotein translocase subunit SecG [Candidatus Eremiobacteraeota bacterium]
MLSLVTLLAAATPAPLGAVKSAAPPRGAPNAAATLEPQVYPQLQNLGLTHKTAMAANLPWLTHTFATIFVILAVGLVVLLAVQTTKQEGLSGTIGGRVESAYRPRLGFDQQLARLTSYVAIGFVFFAVVLSITGI